MKSEVTAVNDRHKADQTATEESLKELARELKESSRAAERRAAQLEEQNTKAQRDVRQQVLEESKRLSDEMEQKHKELMAYIEREGQELRSTLTDRLALADLFAEVALRLKEEFKLPEKR